MNYLDEDFIARTRRVAERSHPVHMSRQTLFRYIINACRRMQDSWSVVRRKWKKVVANEWARISGLPCFPSLIFCAYMHAHVHCRSKYNKSYGDIGETPFIWLKIGAKPAQNWKFVWATKCSKGRLCGAKACVSLPLAPGVAQKCYDFGICSLIFKCCLIKQRTTLLGKRKRKRERDRERERERKREKERKKERQKLFWMISLFAEHFFRQRCWSQAGSALYLKDLSASLSVSKWIGIDFGESNSLMMEHFFARHFPPEIEMIDGSYKCHMSYVICIYFRIGWRKNMQEPLYLMRSTSFVLNFLWPIHWFSQVLVRLFAVSLLVGLAALRTEYFNVLPCLH